MGISRIGRGRGGIFLLLHTFYWRDWRECKDFTQRSRRKSHGASLREGSKDFSQGQHCFRSTCKPISLNIERLLDQHRESEEGNLPDLRHQAAFSLRISIEQILLDVEQESCLGSRPELALKDSHT